MSTINFDQLYQSVQSGVVSLAQKSLQDYLVAAKADGQQTLDQMKSFLESSVKEVADGVLTHDDFVFLLKAEAACSAMTALKETGLAQVRIDQFRTGITDLVVQTVTGII
jgi:methanogenic corrinoid protein MtbC1